MVNLNELKGIDFSTKYYNPQKFAIKNEEYEFYSELDLVWGQLDCEFKSKYFNTKTNISAEAMFYELHKSVYMMQYNEQCIRKLQDLFSDYENINFIELFSDLTVNIPQELKYLRVHEEGAREKYHSFYKSVLGKYGINLEGVDLSEFDKFNPRNPIVIYPYNLDELLNENIEDSNNINFRLAYIFYLQRVSSSHNNFGDKNHYYDINQNHDGTFYGFPIELIKKIAISNNHMIDGKGVGILRYKTLLSDLKSIAKRYDLKQSGTKKVLIKRIESNLTIDEINKEFHGSRFILTDDGEKLLNKFNYNEVYFRSLPDCFNPTELDILCRENPQYSIEEIVYSIVKEHWCELENEEYYDEDDFYRLISSIHRNRYLLAMEFEKDFPEKAIDLYESCLLEQFNKHYFERLSKLYKKHNMQDKTQELLSTMIMNTKRKIEIAKFNIDKVVMEIINKTLELLDEVIGLNNDKKVLRILNRLKRNFELNSIGDNNFYECLIESYDELEDLSPMGEEKLIEIYRLLTWANSKVIKGVDMLEDDLSLLNQYN